MTRRDAVELLVGGAVASTLVGCGGSPRHMFRFRETVEVDTPQGLRSGSSVMEMSAAMAAFKLPDSAAVDLRVKGEAVAVDLPGGQSLFALVGKTPGGDDVRGAVINTFDHRRPGEAKLVAMIEMLGRKESLGREAVMRPQDLPTFVRFRDIRDPKTVELVDPNDLAKSFGTGVKLRRAVLIVVDEPVTVGIEKQLAWLQSYSNSQLDGSRYHDATTVANSLNILDFKTSETK
jgi:hypothetical protein